MTDEGGGAERSAREGVARVSRVQIIDHGSDGGSATRYADATSFLAADDEKFVVILILKLLDVELCFRCFAKGGKIIFSPLLQVLG